MPTKAEFAKAISDAVTPDDVQAIINQLVMRAKRGSITHAREVLDRLLGKPAASVEVTQAPYAGLGRQQLETLIIQALVERGRLPDTQSPDFPYVATPALHAPLHQEGTIDAKFEETLAGVEGNGEDTRTQRAQDTEGIREREEDNAQGEDPRH